MPLFSYGFRPFFLGAALWAFLAMILWIALLSGTLSFAENYGSVAWHSHEFLFGYVSAALTGFLLTAIPNWTGRLPLKGGGLIALWLLWLAGRMGMLLADGIGNVAAAMLDGIYLYIVAAVIFREIIVGGNWRNLKVALLVTLLAVANSIFHFEVLWQGSSAYGIRIAVACIVVLIALIGGRITPSFTTNWLKRQGAAKLPVPFNRFDIAAIALTAVGLLLWVIAPERKETGISLFAVGFVQVIRLARWRGWLTWRESIVLILHIGYSFVPLGAFLLGVSILWPDVIGPAGALHGWTTGAMGVMTLAVMTRATRGHTGHPIESTPATTAIYGAILLAAFARIGADLWPANYLYLLYVSAFAWCASFGGFVLTYGPMLVRGKQPA
jgi:uncharacterized protein involved in response to NO